MTITDITVNSENGWQNLATLISTKIGNTFTFDSSKNYSFLCKNGEILFNNATNTPTDNSGFSIEKDVELIAKIAQGNLFVQAIGGNAVINIFEED